MCYLIIDSASQLKIQKLSSEFLFFYYFHFSVRFLFPREEGCHLPCMGGGVRPFSVPVDFLPGKMPVAKGGHTRGRHSPYVYTHHSKYVYTRGYHSPYVYTWGQHSPYVGAPLQPLLLFRSETASYMVANYTCILSHGYFLGPHLCCWNQSNTTDVLTLHWLQWLL